MRTAVQFVRKCASAAGFPGANLHLHVLRTLALLKSADNGNLSVIKSVIPDVGSTRASKWTSRVA
jgi:hypothetical protein